ncbi:MAG: tyrosine-type recombinase/integrase [Xylophilus ampelinus]
MPLLTVRAIEALKPREKSYKVTVDRNLYLRIAPNGTKRWLVRYVIEGHQHQAVLSCPYGSSGTGGAMSLAQACAENLRIQTLARNGVDVQNERAHAEAERAKSQAAEQAANVTFSALFSTWLSNGVLRKDDNAELVRTFGKDILPVIGHLPVREITDTHLLDALRTVGRVRGRARTAERMLSELRQLFGWAIKRPPWSGLLIHGNPALLVDLKHVVPAGYKATVRERILTAPEIREMRDIFEVMEASYAGSNNRRSATRPLKQESQLALWLCLGIGCRIGELLMARWDHLDWTAKVWHVPAAHTKTNVAWEVQLSDFAIEQFRKLQQWTGHSAWCFPNRDATDHVFVKTVSKQVGDRQVRFKERKFLEHRTHDDSLVLSQGKNGEWTPHDLRRTAATLMQKLGVNPDVIDRCQNHVLLGSRVRRHYLHHDYAEEKRAAWQLLGHHLTTILQQPENIVEFPPQRAA